MDEKQRKNDLLMQALKAKLLQRRINRKNIEGEQPTEDSMYGDRMEDSAAPEMRVPADDMDADFYEAIRRFSGEQEAAQEKTVPMEPDEANYQQLLNLMNKGTGR